MTDSAAEDKDEQKSSTVSETRASLLFLCLRTIDFSCSYSEEDEPASTICHQLILFFQAGVWRKPRLCDM